MGVEVICKLFVVSLIVDVFSSILSPIPSSLSSKALFHINGFVYKSTSIFHQTHHNVLKGTLGCYIMMYLVGCTATSSTLHPAQYNPDLSKMSYRTYQTRSGQSSYSRQPSQASCSLQPRQYSQTQSYGQYSPSQSYATRRPAISSQSRVYHDSDSGDSSSDSEYESDAEDERPRQGSHGYYQATQSSMHELQRAQNAQRYREQQARQKAQRVLETGYDSVHTASTRPMNMLTQSLYAHTPAGEHYVQYQIADQNRAVQQRPAQPQQYSLRTYRTQNVHGPDSGVKSRVQTPRRGGVTRETARRRYY
jgi:hypothetical protein